MLIRMGFSPEKFHFFHRQCFKQSQYNDSNNQQQKQRIKQNMERRITYLGEDEPTKKKNKHEPGTTKMRKQRRR